MHVADMALVVNMAGELLDREFDRVGRLRDGSISEAAVERYGFRWAVDVLCQTLGWDRTKAQGVAKAVGWY